MKTGALGGDGHRARLGQFGQEGSDAVRRRRRPAALAGGCGHGLSPFEGMKKPAAPPFDEGAPGGLGSGTRSAKIVFFLAYSCRTCNFFRKENMNGRSGRGAPMTTSRRPERSEAQSKDLFSNRETTKKVLRLRRPPGGFAQDDGK
jgi:hypothetical protein